MTRRYALLAGFARESTSDIMTVSDDDDDGHVNARMLRSGESSGTSLARCLHHQEMMEWFGCGSRASVATNGMWCLRSPRLGHRDLGAVMPAVEALERCESINQHE